MIVWMLSHKSLVCRLSKISIWNHKEINNWFILVKKSTRSKKAAETENSENDPPKKSKRKHEKKRSSTPKGTHRGEIEEPCSPPKREKKVPSLKLKYTDSDYKIVEIIDQPLKSPLRSVNINISEVIKSPNLTFSPTKSPGDSRISFYRSPNRSPACRSLFSPPKTNSSLQSPLRSPLLSPRRVAALSKNEFPSSAVSKNLFKSPTKSPRKIIMPRCEDMVRPVDVRQSPRKLDYNSPLRLVKQHCK